MFSATSSRKCVSVRQMELLVEYLEGHRDLVLNKCKSREARAISLRFWAKCADILNAEADGDQRTPQQWNKWYIDYKCRLLSRIKQIRMKQHGTSGDPGVTMLSLSPLEERLAALLCAHNEVVGKSRTLHKEVEIKRELPTLEKNSPLPALPTFHPLPSEDRKEISTAANSIIHEDIVDSDVAPMQNNITNSLYSEKNNITESEQESTASRKPNPRRRRLNRQTTYKAPPSSELERSRNMLATLESSRIEVERLMAIGYNKMADATNRMGDAANKSADAQYRIAVALENINNTLQNRNVRRGFASSEED